MENEALPAEELRAYLSEELGFPVRLVVTDNRRTMVSFRLDEGELLVRVHGMFLADGRRIWRSIASFCRNPSRGNRATLDKFIHAHAPVVGDEPPLRTRLVQLDTEGAHHDLIEAFGRVNQRYFKRQCDAKITWGRQLVERRRKRGIQLGSYDVENNLIRIHRVLDAPWVPQYVVDSLVYHEMLHWLFRPRQAGARRVVHGKAFREAEQAHPHHERTRLWIAKHLERLLGR
jgi:hypothetical protein